MAKAKETKKTESNDECCKPKHWHGHPHHGTSGAIYCLGFIGALYYYMQLATTFWLGCLAILKAIGWPAILVYKVLILLHK